MIVLEVGTYQSDKMALPEDNNVLEQLAPATADPAFSHGILPWTTIGRSGGLGAHSPHESHHGGTEDRVPIEYKVPWRGVVRERLAQLLDHPGRCGIGRDIEMKDASSAVLDDEQHVEHPQGNRRHGKEIHCGEDILVIVQESEPTLQLFGGVSGTTWHVP